MAPFTAIQFSVRLPDAPSSYWSDLLGTQALPTPQQITDIKEVISDSSKDVDTLTIDIDRINELCSQLVDRRSKLLRKVDEHQALLAPIRRLPTEVLGLIFVQCLHAGIKTAGIPKINSFNTPFFLSGICRRWREVVLATPQIWAQIWVSQAGKHSAHRAKVYLERSGTVPISLTFINHLETLGTRSRELIGSLLPSSARWQDLKLDMFSEPSMDVFEQFSKVKGNLPHLQSLEVGARHLPTDMDRFHIDLCEVAPQLRSVHLDSPFMPANLTLPWAQLTNLFLRNPPIEVCLSTLQSCPNLVFCRFTDLRNPTNTPLTPISHKQLSYLVVEAREGVQIADLLSFLTLPALRILKLVDERGEAVLGATEVRGLLSRSSCTIQSLNWNIKSTVDDFIHCIALMPSLVELNLNLYHPEVVLRMTHKDDSQSKPLCPQLRTLRLFIPGRNALEITPEHIGVISQTLHEFLQSRGHHPSVAATEPRSVADVDNLESLQLMIVSWHHSPSILDLRKGFSERGFNCSIVDSLRVD